MRIIKQEENIRKLISKDIVIIFTDSKKVTDFFSKYKEILLKNESIILYNGRVKYFAQRATLDHIGIHIMNNKIRGWDAGLLVDKWYPENVYKRIIY